jgi:hypothetical protein
MGSMMNVVQLLDQRQRGPGASLDGSRSGIFFKWDPDYGAQNLQSCKEFI